ncbi:hypothetical protein PTKIN_Ptkin11bG0164400 [Pterospermum kingtungense]
MDCKVVKVEPLSGEESKSLFLDHLRRNVLQNQELEDIINRIVGQCGGLPLAIVTIAGSMKGVDELCEWMNALNELEERVKSVHGSNIQIFERLKFRYDRLGDTKFQSCFLYCCLYPEHSDIETTDLIENWIDEGLLDGLKTRQAMYDRGDSIINNLQNNCLLERDMDTVKMHDVLGDMALYIKSEGPQFMVKAGMQWKQLPMGYLEFSVEAQFLHNLRKLQRNIKFVYCDIEKTDDRMVPNGLATLCLKECSDFKCLSHIPFFHKAIELKRCDIERCRGMECVVDLSLRSCNTLQNIEVLSLRELDNLMEIVREGLAVALTPPAIFSSLKELYLQYCPRVKKLFPIKQLQGLHNLEEIIRKLSD